MKAFELFYDLNALQKTEDFKKPIKLKIKRTLPAQLPYIQEDITEYIVTEFEILEDCVNLIVEVADGLS